MDPTLLIVFVLFAIALAVFGYFKYSFRYWKSRGVLHDEPSIPYGNLSGLGKTVHCYSFTQKLYDKYKPAGVKFCGFYSFTRPTLLLLDLELVKHVFVREFGNFNERNLYSNEKDDPLTGNLFLLDGERWKKLRAKLTPTFSSGKMKFMFPTIVEVTHRFRGHLIELIEKEHQFEMREFNQDVQRKTRLLIQEAYRKHGGELTYEMFMELAYVEQIIEETLRKYSSAGSITRIAKNDCCLPGTDLFIKAGTSIAIPVHAIHQDPEYYPDPKRFDPDRFGNEEKKKRDPMTFLAFGEGPRNCIGVRFAMMQMRIALIVLLSNFKVSVGPQTVVPIEISKSAFVLTPESDVYLNVERIQ